MRVAIIYNLIREDLLEGRVLDVIAEWDSRETIEALTEAIRSGGHEVLLIEADMHIFENLQKRRHEIDIVFNIAEGMDCESRESLVPLLCEILRIPYTGSGPLTLALCLDKVRTKEILAFNGIRTPAFQKIRYPAEPLHPHLRFPLICKLVAEGSSMGISFDSVVDNDAALRRKLEFLALHYPDKPLMVEEYIDGQEFTVPVIGNDEPFVLPIIEVKFDKLPPDAPKIVLFRPDDDYQSVGEIIHNTGRTMELNAFDRYSVCPAAISPETEEKIKAAAILAYRIAECRDWCRMEFRMDKAGTLYFLEMNPIAGIDPGYQFPRSAKALGWSYAELIEQILNAGIRRYFPDKLAH
ncbi:MAG: D-alanine--D-alanine ligase [Anaerolineae bacterium]|nr:D-alanine--D-alanine ligase [Anaerolineae bacterium]